VKLVRLALKFLILGLFSTAIAFCVILSFQSVSTETAVTLVIFNLLFGFLTSLLNETLEKKLLMLFFGNLIGLFWNYVFSLFAVVAAGHFGGFFNAIYKILSPILNLTWIVSFWSISLSFFGNPQEEKWRRRRVDD